jgi:hypothetical protein
VENKDKLFYCIPNAGNSNFLIGYLFNNDKLQYDFQKIHSTFAFNAKNYRGKLYFTYLQTSKNAFLNVELWEVNLLYLIACFGK